MTASGKIGDIFTLGKTFHHNNDNDMTFNLVHNMVWCGVLYRRWFWWEEGVWSVEIWRKRETIQTTNVSIYLYRVYFRILPQRGQMPSSKILGGGGKYKAKEGQPHIKRTEKPIPRGANGSPGPPPPPPEINPIFISNQLNFSTNLLSLA